jgi:GDP-4-dehydro-6-deoxy-D-mannose reductase
VKALITAVDCFIGSWLAESLVADGVQVFGAVRRDPGERDGVMRRVVDVRARDAVFACVRDAAPDVVYHLAARSHVKQSVDDPVTTLTTNVIGSVHVLDAVRAHAPGAHVVSVGSSAEYGETARGIERLSEDLALAPNSPYGVSKVAQGQLARFYARTHLLHVMHVRPFAVIGPRKRGDAIGDFCSNIVRIERGEAERLSVGNTASVRDFVDVRDCVTALRRVAEAGERGEIYNICHGKGVALDEVIEILRGLSRRPFLVEPDPVRARPVDDPRLIGDPTRLLALGHAPQYALAQTLALTLDHWRTS